MLRIVIIRTTLQYFRQYQNHNAFQSIHLLGCYCIPLLFRTVPLLELPVAFTNTIIPSTHPNRNMSTTMNYILSIYIVFIINQQLRFLLTLFLELLDTYFPLGLD